MAAKFHRMSLSRAPDGRVAVTVDILGPIANPLAGLNAKDKLRVLLWPYSRYERAMMKAVKGLPVIARRAVAADILAARREGMTEQRRQQAASAKAGILLQPSAQTKAVANAALVQIQAELLEGAEPSMIS